MTKAVVILKTIEAKGELKEFCQTFQLGYGECCSIVSGKKKPTYQFILKLKQLIPIPYWFYDADKYFVDSIVENLKKELKDKGK